MNLNLEALIQGLIMKGNALARSKPAPDSDVRPPTSIRLRPATRTFIDSQAEALGTSVQAIIGMILDGVAESTLNQNAGALRTIRERFFYLFEAHEIDMPGIISIVGKYGFTLSRLSSGDALLDLLTTTTLREIAELFRINATWLSGAEDNVFKFVYWYKHEWEFCRRILSYVQAGHNPSVVFIRQLGSDFERARASKEWKDEPIGVAIQLRHTTDDWVKYSTYEIGQIERWNYWKCRQGMKVIIMFCDLVTTRLRFSNNLSFEGRELPPESIEALRKHAVVPASIFNHSYHFWHPLDYIDDLDDVPEYEKHWPQTKDLFQGYHFEKMLDEYLSSTSLAAR